jgi:hypothetical protein
MPFSFNILPNPSLYVMWGGSIATMMFRLRTQLYFQNNIEQCTFEYGIISSTTYQQTDTRQYNC